MELEAAVEAPGGSTRWSFERAGAVPAWCGSVESSLFDQSALHQRLIKKQTINITFCQIIKQRRITEHIDHFLLQVCAKIDDNPLTQFHNYSLSIY